MENNQEVALTQMRKSVEKLGSSTESYGDPTLMRFLIARSMDSGKAANMFVQWKKWRASMVPNGFISESELPDELEPRKVFLQGLSRDGYPVLVVKAHKHFPSKDQEQFKKFVIAALDKAIARIKFVFKKKAGDMVLISGHGVLYGPCYGGNHPDRHENGLCEYWKKKNSFKGIEIGNEKLVAILDLQQISYGNVDARGLITGFQFLQSYYPERLAKCFILNMPRFFVAVWRMVSRFLEKATQEKIAIITNDEERNEFIKEIGEETLPEEYGGQAKLVAIQDVVLPPLVV